MFNINDLPDDCLRLVFTKLTLQELIQLRSGTICIRWHLVIDHICSGVRTLKIHGSHQEVQQFNREMFEANAERYCKSSHTNVLVLGKDLDLRVLPSTFPELNNFMISRAEPGEDSQRILNGMLRKWTSTLKTLAMFGFAKSSPKLIGEMWNIISEMSHLSMLNLGGLYREEIPENFPILHQIKFMILVHYLPDLTPVLAQLKSLHGLMLSWIYLSVPQLERALQLNPNLAKNLDFLNLGYIFSPNGNREHNFRKLLSFICRKFEQLKHLNILFSDHVSIFLLFSLRIFTDFSLSIYSSHCVT